MGKHGKLWVFPIDSFEHDLNIPSGNQTWLAGGV